MSRQDRKQRFCLIFSIFWDPEIIKTTYYYYLIIRGGSLKKIAKNIIPKVPTNKKV